MMALLTNLPAMREFHGLQWQLQRVDLQGEYVRLYLGVLQSFDLMLKLRALVA
jgi:hypothetical protein